MFLGSKLRLNCPLGPHQRVIRNSDIDYNRTIHLYFLDAKFQLLDICCSWLYREESFFGSGPNWARFRGFGGNNSSKKCQIELKFWSQVVLIVVKMIFKRILKSSSFYNNQSLSFRSDFDPNFPPEDGQNHK